tara:strand:- start:1505 stop:2377 length:873 start_codon:yes stop_codon:yes gene_type:complete
MFFDEEMLLDLRLNILNKYVDKFVITEAAYMHSGKPKKLIFDINKFAKFKDKIIYKVVNKLPPNLERLNDNDDTSKKSTILINNSNKREHYQREKAQEILKEAEPNDIILVNDIDEIPNLEKINFNNVNKKIIIFKQKVFYYKFNLNYENIIWHGSKACKKKDFISPQWLRDVRHKKYPNWRFDITFSKTKYNSIHYVENGGWHFTNIKSPENIQKKFLNFLHHAEFEESGYNLNDVKKMIKENRILYDLSVDQRSFKWKGEKKLKKVNLSLMPEYLHDNSSKYVEWLES